MINKRPRRCNVLLQNGKRCRKQVMKHIRQTDHTISYETHHHFTASRNDTTPML